MRRNKREQINQWTIELSVLEEQLGPEELYCDEVSMNERSIIINVVEFSHMKQNARFAATIPTLAWKDS